MPSGFSASQGISGNTACIWRCFATLRRTASDLFFAIVAICSALTGALPPWELDGCVDPKAGRAFRLRGRCAPPSGKLRGAWLAAYATESTTIQRHHASPHAGEGSTSSGFSPTTCVARKSSTLAIHTGGLGVLLICCCRTPTVGVKIYVEFK